MNADTLESTARPTWRRHSCLPRPDSSGRLAECAPAAPGAHFLSCHLRASAAPRLAVFFFSALALSAQQPQASDVSAALSKTTKTHTGKLEPALEAIARAWRLHGIRGAERESASQNVKLNHLRLPGIIRLADEQRKPEVEKALRHAWGEVTTAEENRIYALIPVHALRRIASMDAVQSIDLDRPMLPDNGPSKEKIR